MSSVAMGWQWVGGGEENDCFHHINRQRRMRPDLSIFDLPGPYRKGILGVTNICPISIFGIHQYSRNDALIIQKAAQQRYDVSSSFKILFCNRL